MERTQEAMSGILSEGEMSKIAKERLVPLRKGSGLV